MHELMHYFFVEKYIKKKMTEREQEAINLVIFFIDFFVPIQLIFNIFQKRITSEFRK